MSTPTEGSEPAFPTPYDSILTGPQETSANAITRSLGFSKRESAAIQLRVPDSGLQWLDAMIRKANRREAAIVAMLQLSSENDAYQAAANSVRYSDALSTELEKDKE